MKRFLLIIATLALSGCAHSQFKADYLQKYAGHDCQELMQERILVEAKLDAKWTKSAGDGAARGLALNFFDHFPGHEAWDYGIPTGYPAGLSGPPTRNKKRMRRHARWQAIVMLQSSRGCYFNQLAPNTTEEAPAGETK